MKANKCFAMAKNSFWTLPHDRGKSSDEATCYVVEDRVFANMKEMKACGTDYCPFYKEKRADVRRREERSYVE